MEPRMMWRLEVYNQHHYHQNNQHQHIIAITHHHRRHPFRHQKSHGVYFPSAGGELAKNKEKVDEVDAVNNNTKKSVTARYQSEFHTNTSQ